MAVSKLRLFIAASALLTSIGMVGPAKAQDPLPSVRVGTAAFISPANARNNFYGTSTTHTVGPGAPSVRPPEIVELARALDDDPDLMFAFVRNEIDTEFRYGLSKGALGALIDRSGTPFDQAALLVELFREAGLQARYQYGTVTLMPAQFTEWTGIANPAAACQLLSSGAIPGSVNGSTTANCAYSGSLGNVQMNHAWASARIGGVWYAFDPSFKSYAQPAGLNLPSIMGLTSGAPLAQASSGMSSGADSGVPYVRNLNAENLRTTLNGYATALAIHLQQTTPGIEFEDAVGEPVIVRWTPPPGGLRQTTLPYGPASPNNWTEVPDQYRSTLRVRGVFPDLPPVTMWDRTFYADEIYGRRLAVSSNFDAASISTIADYNDFNARIELDGAAIDTFTRTITPTGWAGDVTLTLSHPYAPAADGSATLTGQYMDQTVNRSLFMVLTTTIAHGWGMGGNGLFDAWSQEAPQDKYLPPSLVTQPCDGGGPQTCIWDTQPSGDQTRHRAWAGWVGQSSRFASLTAARANSRVTRHHSLGMVLQNSHAEAIEGDAPPATTDYRVMDGYMSLDLVSGLSVTSETATSADRIAAIRTIADGWALLEASASDQTLDTPDSSWAGGRLAWANRPEAGQDPSGGQPRKIYNFTSANAANAFNLSVFENGYVDPSSQTQIDYANLQRSVAAGAVNAYASAGYTVTTSAETFLGPGRRLGNGWLLTVPDAGSEWRYTPTPERGQSLVAVRSDVSGAPLEIAHVVYSLQQRYKGGGGPSNPWQQASGDADPAADLLRSRFVDRAVALGVNPLTGDASWTTPARLTVGVGEFPYALSAGWTFKPGYQPVGSPGALPTAGWMHDWMWGLDISSSANQGMGQSGVARAAGVLAAIEASLDTYRQTYSVQREMTGLMIADWWRRSLVGNTVTVTRGGSGAQYVRGPDGVYVSPTGSASVRLVQANARVADLSPCFPNGQAGISPQSHSRVWDVTNPSSSVSFSLTGTQGDVQSWTPWELTLGTPGYGLCTHAQGLRLNQWNYPAGVRINFTHDAYGRITGVTNNLGRGLTVPAAFQGTITDNVGRSIISTSTISSGYFTDVRATDAMSQTWRFDLVQGPEASTPTVRADPGPRLSALFEPGAANASLEYEYDSLGRIRRAEDALGVLGQRGPYEFFLAAGTRSVRADPLGGRFTSLFDSRHRHRAYQITDELGHSTLTTYDGRDRVLSRTYPELDQEVFTYDVRDNMLTLTRKAKPGSGLADLLSSITYVEGPTVRVCVTAATCNRPASADGPRTDVVDVSNFTWNTRGQLTEALAPADANGDRPRTQLTYTSFSAGGVTLYLPYQRTERISTSDNVITEYGFDTAANYVLRTVTVDPGGLALRTCYQYNPVGDIVGVADPRQATCPPTVVP